MYKAKMFLSTIVLLASTVASATLPDNFKATKISRTDWNAKEANKADLSMDEKKKVRFIISHTVSAAKPNIDSEKDLARNIQRVHTGKNTDLGEKGWADIGYHFMVGATGTIIEGRELAAAPSCYYGQNSGSVCAAFMGCFDASCTPPNTVTDEMIFAMGVGIAEKAFELGINDLGRHNIQGFSELGNRFPVAPGSRIMQKDASGVAPIDVVVEVAKQELQKLHNSKAEL